MIKIDKSSPPKVAGGKCTELTTQMKAVYVLLLELYKEKTNNKEPATLDYDEWVTIAEKAKVTTKKLDELVEFGSEITHEFTLEAELDDKLLLKLKETWLSKLKETIEGHGKAVLVPRWERWVETGKIDLKDKKKETWAKAVYGFLQRLFQRRCLMRQSGLFSDEEWTEYHKLSPLKDEKIEAFKFAASNYLLVLKAEAITLTVGENEPDKQHPMRPLYALAGDIDKPLSADAMWDVLFPIYSTQLKERRTWIYADPVELLNNKDVRPYLGQVRIAAKLFETIYSSVLEKYMTVKSRPLIGFKSEAIDSKYYSGHGIKEALMKCHYGKCVFCEAKVRHIAHGDVEHFRPKAGYDQGHTFNRNGYFWEAYSWENLYYSCQICNQVYKKNRFPVLLDKKLVEVRSTPDHSSNSSSEQPVLIDPGKENPRDFLRFNPIDGSIYPYDLTKAYYEKYPPKDAKSFKDVAEMIWSDAKRIPDKKHELWQQVHKLNPVLMRSVRTFQILGLDRRELTDQRVSHLRHLRGLFLTALSKGAEANDAFAALESAVKPSAEFSSLAIDALETWKREAEAAQKKVSLDNKNLLDTTPVVDPWIKRYNEILAKQPDYEEEEEKLDDVVGDASIMYFIQHGSKLDQNKERLLIHLTAKEELEDKTVYGKGWFLAIPDEDHELTVTWKGKRKVKKKWVPATETYPLSDLLEANQPWRKFADATLTVAGGFFMKVPS